MDTMRLQLVLWLASLVVGALGFSQFREAIPNADKVPGPVESPAVGGGGSSGPGGGGAINVFGRDFNEKGNRWTPDVCNLDSDGDGRTNGEELGDPNCTWIPGQTPAISQNISHPGICEPVSSATCQRTPVPQSRHNTTFTTQQDWITSICAVTTSTDPDSSGGSGHVTDAVHLVVILPAILVHLLFAGLMR